jgi:four helix bundle protein
LPKTEIFALADQMKRAAVSIPANIAEAFGRTGSKDKINFYVYARGSAFELRSHILIALNLGFFTQSEMSSVEEVLKNITLAINKIIKGFQHPHP